MTYFLARKEYILLVSCLYVLHVAGLLLISFSWKYIGDIQFCLFSKQHGHWPIQLAAYFGTRKDVEILFGVTSRIPAVHDWSVDGIISYVKAQPKLEV